jgi:DNA-binding PadR family transcriptional regulator
VRLGPRTTGFDGPPWAKTPIRIARIMVPIELVLNGLYAVGVATATSQSAGLSTTEFAVLGLLSFGERSGYELKKAAEAGVGYVWTAAKSHVYGVLPRLVEGGYATTRRVTQERRPDKQVYRITRKGQRAFHEWLEAPIEERVPEPVPAQGLSSAAMGGRRRSPRTSSASGPRSSKSSRSTGRSRGASATTRGRTTAT